MTFIQWEFLAFFGLVYTAYWLVGNRKAQNVILAVCSAIFYGWVHPWFLILLYSSAVVDFFIGRQMRRTPERSGWLLTASMAFNLGMLGYFKYCDFFIENVVQVLDTVGLQTNLTTLGIFLPVGISFYTFQTMSYTIDIYRKKLEPRDDFLDYVVFVSFFPQLVAGPVERASNLLPQMEKDRVFSLAMARSGFALAIWGAFKKVAVADVVAPYVDRIFILKEPTTALVMLGAVGFAVQILADFSGYTDIARGIARMLGFELIENFKHPYVARNPSDFWRRWHVSFSTWIRDYLYIPLGGSRGGWLDTLKATFGAMVLSGLWHGASWNFVLWGAYHASLITGYREVKPRLPDAVKKQWWSPYVAIVIMFFFTCLGWLIFRQTSITQLISYLSLPHFIGDSSQQIAAVAMLAVISTAAAPLVFAYVWDTRVKPQLQDSRWYLPLQTTAWAAWAVVIVSLVRTTDNDFIYFQF